MNIDKHTSANAQYSHSHWCFIGPTTFKKNAFNAQILLAYPYTCIIKRHGDNKFYSKFCNMFLL